MDDLRAEVSELRPHLADGVAADSTGSYPAVKHDGEP
jgi:hypothetical protein